jgi:hypothetical protein
MRSGFSCVSGPGDAKKGGKNKKVSCLIEFSERIEAFLGA